MKGMIAEIVTIILIAVGIGLVYKTFYPTVYIPPQIWKPTHIRRKW